MNQVKAVAAHIVLGAALAASTAACAGKPEDAFAAENDAAMNTMMDAMDVRPSGDIDRDFVAMMVPHHQGAIDMAAIYLRYGKDERLRRLAQEIVVTQKDEIAAMRLVVQPAPEGHK
jgi:uncharacterized protein (DUF305 family)